MSFVTFIVPMSCHTQVIVLSGTCKNSSAVCQHSFSHLSVICQSSISQHLSVVCQKILTRKHCVIYHIHSFNLANWNQIQYYYYYYYVMYFHCLMTIRKLRPTPNKYLYPCRPILSHKNFIYLTLNQNRKRKKIYRFYNLFPFFSDLTSTIFYVIPFPQLLIIHSRHLTCKYLI